MPNLAYAHTISIAFKTALSTIVVAHVATTTAGPTLTKAPLTPLELVAAMVGISLTVSTPAKANFVTVCYAILEKGVSSQDCREDLVVVLVYRAKG